jgi:hypothetical protein
VKPSIGRIVHYVSYGTPGGEYPSKCRAAVVADIQPNGEISLVVLNPTGLFFNLPCPHDEDTKLGGTWHWPEQI